jgi:peptide/nickel transport system substrate-binding protein
MKKLSVSSMLVLLFVIAGCGGKEGSAGQYGLSTKNNVVWWVLSDADRLNPYTSTDANAAYIQQKIWEPLNFQHPVTLELLPGIASLPEISEDYLTYTFTMNPKAHWSDGKPLTSADVIFSFKTAKNPYVINSQQLRNYLQDIDSVYNPDGDQSKVAFKLSKFYYDVHNIIAGGYVLILPKHIQDPKSISDQISWDDVKKPAPTNPAVKEFATWFESPEIGRDPKYQIGSGPYVFKEWKTFQYIKLGRDPKYWGQNEPWMDVYPDEIIYKTINDQNAALTALKGQDIDFMDQLKPDQYLTQLDTNKQKFIKKDTIYWNVYAFIAWNNERPLFADKTVRKALTMLINRDEIIDNIMKGLCKKVNGPITPGQPNYDPSVSQPEYNPQEAKRLLQEAGWTDSDGDGTLDKVLNGKKTPFKFVFLSNAGNEVRKQILLVISEQLRKAGITAEVTALEWSVYLENTKSHQYDACYGSWAGNAGEDDIYQLWHSSQSKNKGSNYSVFKNAEADKLMTDIRNEPDKQKRYAMAYRLQHVIADEQPVSFLFSQPLLFARLDRFDNVQFFRQRPCFDARYWIVKGSGAKKVAASF